LGSRRRVASGISWAFSLVEEAIILEDDCLPDQSFFRFCKELLAHYRADQRVMHVGGTNLAPRGRMDASYLFSKYPLSWGWATWRRAWMLFDDKLKHWPSVREGGWLRDYIGDDKAALDQWSDRLDAIADERFDSWATIWTFSCWMNHGLSILPVENLVTNIGLGAPDATHTRHNRHLELMKDTRPMEFPLKHPEFMIRDRKTDEYLSQQLLAVKSYAGVPGFFRRLRRLQRRRQRARRESTS
jgi:hypothetical protein